MSILNVNKINPVGGGSTITIAGIASVTGNVTATAFVGDGSNLTGITGTTINNNADNRVITGSGSANTLNGEANLTFNSSLVVTDGNGTVTTGGNYINLKRTSATVNYINAPLADAELHISADENIVFKTVHTGDFNSTERLRIGSAGQLGVGSTAYYGQAGDCLVSQGTSVGVAYTAIPNIFDSSGQSISDYGKMRIKFKTVAVSGTGNVHLGLCRGGVPGNCVAGEIGIPIGFIPGCEYNASFTVGDISVTPWPSGSNRYEYYVNISAFSVAGSLGIFYLGQD